MYKGTEKTGKQIWAPPYFLSFQGPYQAQQEFVSPLALTFTFLSVSETSPVRAKGRHGLSSDVFLQLLSILEGGTKTSANVEGVFLPPVALLVTDPVVLRCHAV